MPFCLRAASCASAFCFAFGAIWRRWRSIVRVQFASASDLRAKLAARSATMARSKRRSSMLLRPCQARVSPSACNFARRNGAQVAAVESATPTDLATARLGTLVPTTYELRLLYLRGSGQGPCIAVGSVRGTPVTKHRFRCVYAPAQSSPPRPRKRCSNRRTRDRNVVTLDSALSHSLHSLRSLSPVSCLLLVCLSLDGFHTRHPRFEVHVEVLHLGNVVVNALGWG